MERQHFISPDALEQRLGNDDLSILCNFMYLPNQKGDGYQEFLEDRIPGAVFFDIDKIADQESELPHMIAPADQFAKQMGELGVSDQDLIVIYDGPGLYSSARIWWNLKVMGATNVRILEGGYDLWIDEDRPVDETPFSAPVPKNFDAKFDAGKVINAQELLALIDRKSGTVLDARSLARFRAEADEPREGLRSGHMPESVSVPFTDLIENGKLIENNRLQEVFKLIVSDKGSLVTSCGSGVTAAVLSLALDSAGYHDHRLFDGSWTQWGDEKYGLPVLKGG